MTLLVFGRTGQVGIDLERQLGPDAPFLFLGRDRADLEDPGACAAIIRDTRPAVVINTAAFTDVEAAEADEARAHVVNAEAPGAMARACAALKGGRGVPFIHLSTDYVFDGAGEEPWRPGDTPAPLNAYGRTKLAGEEAIRAAGGPHAILRTSWVVSAHGRNFVKTMVRLGAEREELRVVADQIGAPTPAYDLARACLITGERLLENPGLSGTYHYQGAPHASWAEVAEAVMRAANLPCQITPVPSTAYPTKAERPLNSRLNCMSTEATLGLRRPDWRRGLGFILSDLGVRG